MSDRTTDIPRLDVRWGRSEYLTLLDFYIGEDPLFEFGFVPLVAVAKATYPDDYDQKDGLRARKRRPANRNPQSLLSKMLSTKAISRSSRKPGKLEPIILDYVQKRMEELYPEQPEFAAIIRGVFLDRFSKGIGFDYSVALDAAREQLKDLAVDRPITRAHAGEDNSKSPFPPILEGPPSDYESNDDSTREGETVCNSEILPYSGGKVVRFDEEELVLKHDLDQGLESYSEELERSIYELVSLRAEVSGLKANETRPLPSGRIKLLLSVLAIFVSAICLHFVVRHQGSSGKHDMGKTSQLESRFLAESRVGPKAFDATAHYDNTQSAIRTDDVLLRAIETRLRIGLAGGDSGFEFKTQALPDDTVGLSLYVQNHFAPTDQNLQIVFRLPEDVEYIPGRSFVLKKQEGKEYSEPIPEQHVYRHDREVQMEFTPRTHAPSDAIYLNIQCRVGGRDVFPFGTSDREFRAVVSIGEFNQKSDPVHVSVRKSSDKEVVAVASLYAWNKHVSDGRWVHRNELVGKPGEIQKFRILVTNRGTVPIRYSKVELTSSRPLRFSPQGEVWRQKLKPDYENFDLKDGELSFVIRDLIPGTRNARLFVATGQLQNIDSSVTVRLRLTDGESVLANDSVDIHPLAVPKP